MAYKVLVFDDDDAIRALLKEALSQKGCEVETYANPTDFPFLHEKNCPCTPEQSCADMIIADIVMPGMEGIDFMRKLKDAGCWPLSQGNVAIISGYLTLHYMEELEALGAQYFRKPFSLDDIYQWVEGCQKRLEE